MFSIFGTVILYTLLIISCLFLTHYGEMKNDKRFINASYLLIFLICALRFDIGNDYSNYAYSVQEIASYSRNHNLLDVIKTWRGTEITISLFTVIFSRTSRPIIGVSAIYSLINIILLNKICERNHCHKWGIFVFIVSQFMFLSWDWMRQCTAILIALFSFAFIEEKKPIKFIIAILLASLFHTSAIFLFPIYFLRIFRFKNWIYWVIVIVALFLYFAGLTRLYRDAFNSMFLFSEDYAGQFMNKWSDNTFEGLGYKLRTVFISLSYCYLLTKLEDNHKLWTNMLLVGILLYVLGMGALTLTRISWYFLATIIPAAGVLMSRKNDPQLKKILIVIVVGWMFFFYRDTVQIKNRGCTPYETIFSKKAKNNQYREDGYLIF